LALEALSARDYRYTLALALVDRVNAPMSTNFGERDARCRFQGARQGTRRSGYRSLSALIEWLCVSKQLSPDDLKVIFDDAEDRLAGDLNMLRDARKVIEMMKSRLAIGD
jgi:hypothetical protein